MKFILAIIGSISAVKIQTLPTNPEYTASITPVGVFCTWDAVNGLQSKGECKNGLTLCPSLSKEREDNQKAEDTGSNARRSCALDGIKKG